MFADHKIYFPQVGEINMVYLYAIHITEFELDDNLKLMKQYLSEKKRKQVERFRKIEDQVRGILGESLLKYILWSQRKYSDRENQFNYNEYGKPELVDVPNVYFNISHSGHWVLCAVSDHLVGLDVEGENAVENSVGLQIAKSQFTEKEYNYIKNQSEERQLAAFYQIWTLKESYIKCVGKGLSIPLRSFSFEINENQIILKQSGEVDQSYQFKSMQIDAKNYVAICVRNPEIKVFENSIKRVTVEEMQNFYQRYESII